MISKWIPFGLLDYAGFKLYEEFFDNIIAHHIEIIDNKEEALHVAFLEERGKQRYNFKYYFGTFREKIISTGVETHEQLDDLRRKLISVKKPENKIKAKELENKLLATLFAKGYENTIKAYYNLAWLTELAS